MGIRTRQSQRSTFWAIPSGLLRLPIPSKTSVFSDVTRSASGPIRLVARTQLGARESLCLVEVGPTTLLIALTAQSIQTLHVWPEGIGATSPGRPATAEPRSAVPGQLRELAARLSGTR